MLLRCGVSSWQSMSVPPFCCIVRARKIRASLEADGTRENMLSPKKAEPMVTPYSPPTSSPSLCSCG